MHERYLFVVCLSRRLGILSISMCHLIPSSMDGKKWDGRNENETENNRDRERKRERKKEGRARGW